MRKQKVGKVLEGAGFGVYPNNKLELIGKTDLDLADGAAEHIAAVATEAEAGVGLLVVVV